MKSAAATLGSLALALAPLVAEELPDLDDPKALRQVVKKALGRGHIQYREEDGKKHGLSTTWENPGRLLRKSRWGNGEEGEELEEEDANAGS